MNRLYWIAPLHTQSMEVEIVCEYKRTEKDLQCERPRNHTGRCRMILSDGTLHSWGKSCDDLRRRFKVTPIDMPGLIYYAYEEELVIEWR